MPSRIEDYAVIGDLQTAALVSRTGSVDWLCFPRFDSAACFAALLGDERHGRWLIAPAAGGLATRRGYRGDSMILQTGWETPEGAVRVIDFMPPRGRDSDIVRIPGRGDPTKLRIMYGPAGEPPLAELELPWLPGYENSAPVRTGNAAHDQRQLDVYGELMDALHQARRLGIEPDPSAWALQRALINLVGEIWREPDEGIWEVRGGRRHFTRSKVLAWVALDRAVKSVTQLGLPGPAGRWKVTRDQVRRSCARGSTPSATPSPGSTESRELDASLMLLPSCGFLPATDARMRGTVAAIEHELVADGFVQRYPTGQGGSVDGLPGTEGAFLACSFWLADNYALAARDDDATRLLERLLELRNDVGLLSEEYDPKAGRLVGNFPQAFSPVPLISTALHLDRAAAPDRVRMQTDRPAPTPTTSISGDGAGAR